MIVLDEQLAKEPGLAEEVARWYQGAVSTVIELGWSGEKDENLVRLLLSEKYCTFATENERDFWRTTATPPHPHYCVVCFALQAGRRSEIPRLLRWLFLQPEFHTRRRRCGSVVRISSRLERRREHIEVRYYRRLAEPEALEARLQAILQR